MTVATPEPHIRPARASDDRELASLDARSWPVELQVAPPTRADEAFFGARREPADVIVASVGDRLVGYVQLARHTSMAVHAHVLHLNALVVDPATRGSGVGGRLVGAAIDEARRRGVRKLGLRVLSNNPGAVRIYERFGFVREGRLREEFLLADGTYADDLWYALDLSSSTG